jgi:hypothetical protein
VLAITLLLALALYIAGTPLGAATISGLQGRYFIPLALPLLLISLRTRPDAGARAPLVVAALMTLANCAALLAIARAFYA